MSSYGVWLSAAGMQLQEHRQNVLANNLANMQTTGFKEDLAIVRERATASRETPGGRRFTHPVLEGLSGGLVVQPVHHSFAQGALERTGRPLDIAVEGTGFFEVQDGENTRYTRDGVLTLNAEGELVMSAGQGRWRLMSIEGAPVRVDPSGGDVDVASDGTVRQSGAAISRIALREPEDLKALRKVGENLFELRRGEMTAGSGRIIAGAKEASNFDMMKGLASMIEATRAYQLNASMLQFQDEMTGQAIGRVGKVA